MNLFSLRDGLCARLVRLIYGRRFRRLGRNSRILFPTDLIGLENIEVGDDVYVGHRTTLAALPLTGSATTRLTVGSGTHLGSYNHIYCTRRVAIGDNVLTANGVYISDNLHGYEDTAQPIMDQAIRQVGDVEIGSGAWLGHHCSVIGAKVGRQSVIGANAVVTRDIPDFAVAVGAPAIIIKRFDPTTQTWRATHPDGRFKDETSPQTIEDVA